MKKIKLFLLTLFAFIGLSASSQLLTSFNVDVVNIGGCPYTLFGNYYGGNGLQGSIIFTPQPNGGYVAVVPGVDSLTLSICAEAAAPERERCRGRSGSSAGGGGGAFARTGRPPSGRRRRRFFRLCRAPATPGREAPGSTVPRCPRS